MDVHQTSTSADDSSDLENDPSNKRVKYDSPKELPEELIEEMPIQVYNWIHMVGYGCPTRYDPQVYRDIIDECEQEIDDYGKVYEAATRFFNDYFANLDKIQPCADSTTVVLDFSYIQEGAKVSLDRARESFPFFKKYVEKYMVFREGPLETFDRTEERYYKKLEELAEVPGIVKVLKTLMSNAENREDSTELTRLDISGIEYYLLKNKDLFLRFNKEEAMNEEEDGETEMEDLPTEYQALKKEIPPLRLAYEEAEAARKKHENEGHIGYFKYVCGMEKNLGTVCFRLRTMHRQLELLLNEDVINKGYGPDFYTRWSSLCCGEGNVRN